MQGGSTKRIPASFAEQYGRPLSVDLIGPIRRNPCHEKHKAHAGERTIFGTIRRLVGGHALQMPDEDAGDPEDVEQDERR